MAGVSAVGLVAGSVACLDPNTVTVTATSVETSQDDKTDTVLYTFYDKITTNVTATFTGTTLPHGSGGQEDPRQCDGRTFVHVVLKGAAAHDERGVGTTQGAFYPRRSSSIAEVCLIEDYEGYVHYAVGLSTTKAPKLKVQRTGGIMRVLITKT